jgi:lambda family phage tail tape measure protein
MAVIGSLSVKLGLVTVEWDKATAQAKRQAKDLQSAFNDLGVNMQGLKNLFQQLGGAAGLSVAGFAAMSHSVLQLAGDLDDVSKTYDVSIAKVLQFQNALVQAGGKSEDAGKIIANLFAKISDAQQGNESAIASFENLGISFQDLRAMSPEEALNKVYKGLSNIGNTYDRVKAVKEILGKGGLHKSVEEISEALGKSSAEFKRQEVALKAWADAGDRIDRMMLNLKLAFAEFFKVFVGGDFVPSVNQFKSAMVAITSVMVINGMMKLVAAFKALNVALKSTAALGIAIQSAQGVKGIAMAGGALAAYFGAMKVFEDQDEETDAADENATPEPGKGSSDDGAGSRRTIDAMQAKIKLAKDMLRIDAERHMYQMHYLTGSQDQLLLEESFLKYQEDIAKATQARADALKAENLSSAQKGGIQSTFNIDTKKADQERKQRDELINAKHKIAIDAVERQINLEQKMSAIKADQALLENERATMTVFEYDKQRENYALQEKLLNIEHQRQELREKYKENEMAPEFVNSMTQLNNAEATEKQLSKIRDRGIEQERMRVQDFNTGWDYALQQYVMNSENAGRTASDMFSSLTGNMEAAITNFVRTGKLSFKDLARSIIQDIIAIQMRAAASKFLGSLFGNIGSGGNASSGGWFENVYMAAEPRASGGPVSAGNSYMVGERGAELFVPTNSGTIIPNAKMNNMGSTTNVTNNYINAIDTKSFEDRLLGSSNAIWAANQYAGKSLAVNRGRA